jgi:membrane AbrB-like protein
MIGTLNGAPALGAALALGAAGAGLAWLVSVPAPFILGPAVVVTIAGVSGLATEIPVSLRNGVFVVIGAIMGSGVTPQVLDAARHWPQSFAILALSLVLIMAVTTALFRWLYVYDHVTAVLSSTPGHLSFILGLGAATGGNLAAISVIQSVRLLALTLFVPMFVAFGGHDIPAAPGSATGTLPLLQLAAMLPACAALGLALHWLRLPAAFLIGAMLVSTLAHLTGTVEGLVPDWLAIPSFIVMGTMIGTRFSGVRPHDLARYAGAGLMTTCIAVVIAGVAAYVSSWLTGLPLAPMLVAFAPGGVETMAAIALLINADPAFVAAHHVMRLFFLTALVPLFLGRTKKRG